MEITDHAYYIPLYTIVIKGLIQRFFPAHFFDKRFVHKNRFPVLGLNAFVKGPPCFQPKINVFRVTKAYRIQNSLKWVLKMLKKNFVFLITVVIDESEHLLN